MLDLLFGRKGVNGGRMKYCRMTKRRTGRVCRKCMDKMENPLAAKVSTVSFNGQQHCRKSRGKGRRWERVKEREIDFLSCACKKKDV